MPEPLQHTVPIDAVARKTAEQRNNAHDALARAEVFIEELLAENERLAAELAQLRTSADQGLSAVTVHTPNGESTLASRTT